MKMALDFLLGLYTFLFVVVAIGKNFKNYSQETIHFQHKTKTVISLTFSCNYTEGLRIFISYKEVICVWMIYSKTIAMFNVLVEYKHI